MSALTLAIVGWLNATPPCEGIHRLEDGLLVLVLIAGHDARQLFQNRRPAWRKRSNNGLAYAFPADRGATYRIGRNDKGPCAFQMLKKHVEHLLRPIAGPGKNVEPCRDVQGSSRRGL